MNLSEYTKKLLTNFASINTGIVIRETPDGQNGKISVKSKNGDVFGFVEVEEKFPTNICLYDLPAFLNALKSIDENASVDFKEDHALVHSEDGKSKVKIIYSSPEMIIHPNPTGAVLPEALVTFDLSEYDLAKMKELSSVMGLTHFKLFSDDGKIVLQALVYDENNRSSNTFDRQVGTTDKDFSVFILKENLKMVPGDYTVEIIEDLCLRFTNKVDSTLVYIVSLQDLS